MVNTAILSAHCGMFGKVRLAPARPSPGPVRGLDASWTPDAGPVAWSPRASLQTHAAMVALTDSRIVFSLLRQLRCCDVEEVWAIALRPDKTVVRVGRIFRGTVDQCHFHPRDIFRFAVLHNASSIIVAHNHPHNDVEPSVSDLLVTRQIEEAGRLLQIPLTDHLIVGPTRFVSLLERGHVGAGRSGISESHRVRPSRDPGSGRG
jgi:hypothetical protein